MVHNQNRILDECEIKYVDECIMVKPKYIIDFETKLWDARRLQLEYEHIWNNSDKIIVRGGVKQLSFPGGKRQYENSDEKRICDAWNSIQKDTFLMQYLNWETMDKKWAKGDEKIAEYMGVIPFMPCVMFNISPNWKGEFGKDKVTDKIMQKKLCIILDKYLNASNRYSKYKYVLECGSDGNHLHAHAVAEIKKGMEKSVQTHINKGNHSIEIRKLWDKEMPKGKQGLLKGKYSIQRIMLRNENLVKDKLDYLIEEKKPEGHKNKEDLGILVSVGF